jgi:hypothetical protein
MLDKKTIVLLTISSAVAGYILWTVSASLLKQNQNDERESIDQECDESKDSESKE